jgi:Fe-S-cluster containining protein
MADERGLQAARPFRFACQRCGHCCSGGSGYVWVEESEIESMARVLGMSQENFTARYLKRALDPRRGVEAWSLRERADAGGACALLVGRNTCLVYEARPRHCREFPYWEHVLAGGEGFEAARETCPGIAVVVPPEKAAPAFAALQQVADELIARHALSSELDACCLSSELADERWCSGLEADRAAAAAPAASGCKFGSARPLACVLAGVDDAHAHEAARSTVRALERAHEWPASYGPLRAQLRSRGVEASLPTTKDTDA